MFKNKIFLYIVAVSVFIISAVFLFNKNGDFETHVVEKSDFIETTEISGRVVPAQELDLAFEVVGRVSRVNVDTGDFVNAGDVLVELDTSEISSELSEVISNLEREQSRLAEVSGDITSQNKLQNSAETLLSTIKKSYTTADDVIKNKVDLFFENPNQRIPEFTTALSNYFLRIEIRKERYEVGEMLINWESNLNSLDPAIIDNQDANSAIENLKKVESLLAKISSNVDDYRPTGSVTKAEIDAYITSISNSRNTISSLIVEINNVYDSFRSVQADLPVLQASVDNARATVDKLSSRRGKYVLMAPFNGVITEQNVESGQVVSVNENIISMISGESFEVEGYIPELNIIGVDVGDPVKLSLDAFGEGREFQSEVSHIDPRETIKDGVTTYRTLVNFLKADENLRSGMTVDVEIQKELIEDQIIVPRYLISEDEQGNYVYIKNEDKKQRRDLELGDTDGRGGIIVVNGLSVGDEVIIEK